MKFAVIGLGSIGQRHAANLLALGHEVAGYNRGNKRREMAAKRLGIPVYSRISDLFDWGGDAALVCTPQHMHLEHSLAAARRGLHLFIEKPLSDSLEGLSTLEREAEDRGLICHVGCNMRFHFGPSLVCEKLDTGALGRPLWAHLWGGMHLPDWHPNEDYRRMYSAKKDMGGGAVLDFIHEIDLALWLFSGPDRIAAMTSQSGWLEIETEDVVDALLGYAGGLQVSLHLDYLQKPFQRGIRVVGTSGWACWDLARAGVETFFYDRGEIERHPYPEGYDNNVMYVEQMKYFVGCIQENAPSFSDIGSGERALDLALKIKESSAKNIFI